LKILWESSFEDLQRATLSHCTPASFHIRSDEFMFLVSPETTATCYENFSMARAASCIHRRPELCHPTCGTRSKGEFERTMQMHQMKLVGLSATAAVIRRPSFPPN
jgi:hypothetical protein